MAEILKINLNQFRANEVAYVLEKLSQDGWLDELDFISKDNYLILVNDK